MHNLHKIMQIKINYDLIRSFNTSRQNNVECYFSSLA